MRQLAWMHRWSLWMWLLENDGSAPRCQGVPSFYDFLYARLGSAIMTFERGKEVFHVDPGATYATLQRAVF